MEIRQFYDNVIEKALLLDNEIIEDVSKVKSLEDEILRLKKKIEDLESYYGDLIKEKDNLLKQKNVSNQNIEVVNYNNANNEKIEEEEFVDIIEYIIGEDGKEMGEYKVTI